MGAIDLDEAIMIVEASIQTNELQVKAGLQKNNEALERLFSAFEVLVSFAKKMKAKHELLASLNGSSPE